jgi:hypothetical protein
MIVPTLTMFGRVRECTREVSKVLLATGAVVTLVIMASACPGHDRGWACVAEKSDQPDTGAPALPGHQRFCH